MQDLFDSISYGRTPLPPTIEILRIVHAQRDDPIGIFYDSGRIRESSVERLGELYPCLREVDLGDDTYVWKRDFGNEYWLVEYSDD